MVTLTTRSDDRIRLAATTTTVIVAISAAVLSWHGLTQLGKAAGLGPLSVLLPLVIDGGMLVGALQVLHSELIGKSTRWGWGMTLSGIALSVWGNIAGASQLTWASAVVHAVPALALAATIEATMQIIRHRVTHQRAPETPAHTLHNDDSPTDVDAVFDRLTHADPASEATPKNRDVPQEVVEEKPHITHVLRAVPSHTHVDEREIEMALWMRHQKEQGAPTSAAAAHKAGIATSESTARRIQKQVKKLEADHGADFFTRYDRTAAHQGALG